MGPGWRAWLSCGFFLVSCLLATMVVMAAKDPSIPVNFDESQVPDYTLPDPLTSATGEPVKTAEAWRTARRPELLQLFSEHVYGAMPPPCPIAAVETRDFKIGLGEVAAPAQEATLYFRADRSGPAVRVLLVMPPASGDVRRWPVFLGYNFNGNHTVCDDTNITLAAVWNKQRQRETADAATRGRSASRWPIANILAHGYALATVYYGDVAPDHPEAFDQGVHGLYPTYQDRSDNWAAIGGWAWGLSRVLDYLQTQSQIDSRRVAVIGHSRLGKTALWTGATDQRFALVVSNNSGCGGAALARRRMGETVAHINTSFPHWFCRNHHRYNGHEDDLPVDQHELLALIAPRPLYVASATQDRWADPKGEFLAAVAASEVYRLLGTDGLPATQWPAPQTPLIGRIGYHLRSGKHDVTAYDWERYLNFADRHFAEAGQEN
jgi:hypothetical protein